MRASTYQRKASKIVSDTASEINAYFTDKKEYNKTIWHPAMKSQIHDKGEAFFQWELPFRDKDLKLEQAEAEKCLEIINGIKKPRIKGEQIEITAEQIGNIFYLTIIFNHLNVKPKHLHLVEDI